LANKDYDHIRHASFELMHNNFPTFLLLTGESQLGLAFNVHGLRISQIDAEIDLGEDLNWISAGEANRVWILSGEGICHIKQLTINA